MVCPRFEFHDPKRGTEPMVASVGDDHFSVLCPTVALDDRAAARRIGIRGQWFWARSTGHRYGGAGLPDEAAEPVVVRLYEHSVPVRPMSTATCDADHTYGTAKDVMAQVERPRDAGAGEVMCLIQRGTAPKLAWIGTIRQRGVTRIAHFGHDARARPAQEQEAFR